MIDAGVFSEISLLASLEKMSAASFNGPAHKEMAYDLGLVQAAIGAEPTSTHEKWYLVDCKWWDVYLAYLMSSVRTCHPGAVNNFHLLEHPGNGELKKGMVESIHYVFVPQGLWQSIVKNFGLAQGQEAIERNVIVTGLFKKHARIEVYPLELSISLACHACEEHKVSTSCGQNLVDLRRMMIRKLGVEFNSFPADVRVYQRLDNKKYELLRLWDRTLYDIGLTDNRRVVLDMKQTNGEWAIKEDGTLVDSSTNGHTCGHFPREPDDVNSRNKPDLLSFRATFPLVTDPDGAKLCLSDVKLICDDKSFNCHRIILAERSSTFQRMFTGGFAESSNKPVIIDDITGETMLEILRFIYCGYLEIDVSKATPDVQHEFLYAAVKYDLKTLVDHLVVSFRKKLNPSTACRYLIWADRFDLTGLKSSCFAIMAKHTNTEAVLTSAEWQDVVANKQLVAEYYRFSARD